MINDEFYVLNKLMEKFSSYDNAVLAGQWREDDTEFKNVCIAIDQVCKVLDITRGELAEIYMEHTHQEPVDSNSVSKDVARNYRTG
jgi:hypothetical protein|tara:strand:+ start:919 stop:1176 length:258 start_codon:yes stop_codon:yes gene_type:complete